MLDDIKKELLKKSPSIVKRCPKCEDVSLVYGNGKMKCTKCGFEEQVELE